MPTVVGRRGVVATLEIELWAKEVQALRKSGQVLRETLDGVLARLGQAGASVLDGRQDGLRLFQRPRRKEMRLREQTGPRRGRCRA